MPVSDLRKIAPDLELTPQGWWRSPNVSDVAYPTEGNSLCFAVEDSSFWFRHRNRCIVEAVRRFPPPGPIFDIGGGNGCVARAVQDAGFEVVVVEPGLAGVENSLKRGIRQVVRSTLQDMGAAAETVPAAGLFDVVEHIPDDAGFLAEAARFLTPGGRVYITVPAYDWLWSHEDVLAGHSRRYTISKLRRVLESARFEVEYATYFFTFLPIPIFLQRSLPYRLALARDQVSEDTLRSAHSVENPLLGRVLERLTKREASRIASARPFRWGGSCLAVARKR
jgi:SAM-dependent methyltransferase